MNPIAVGDEIEIRLNKESGKNVKKKVKLLRKEKTAKFKEITLVDFEKTYVTPLSKDG